MLAVSSQDVVISFQQRRQQRRHSSLHFSSTKALRRSRMTKGKKTSLKRGQASGGNTEKALDFGSGSNVGEDDGGVCNIAGTGDAFGDAISSQVEGSGDVDVRNVSCLTTPLLSFLSPLYHITSIKLERTSLSCVCVDSLEN